jgi:hypothetical protein
MHARAWASSNGTAKVKHVTFVKVQRPKSLQDITRMIHTQSHGVSGINIIGKIGS